MTKVKFRNKYQLGEEDLPVKYVKRNDPRIQASADSIYAYNTTRGNSPFIISDNIRTISSSNNMIKRNNELLSNPKIPQKVKTEILENNKYWEEKKIRKVNPNLYKEPVKPGAFGSKVTVKKSKKPTVNSPGYDSPNDPELERIQKKNKPIHYLSEERYEDEPLNSSHNYEYDSQSSTPKKGTNLYKILKPTTAKVEINPNIEELKKIYPNIPQTEIDKVVEKAEKYAKIAESRYYHPNTYAEYRGPGKYKINIVPNKPEIDVEGEEYKKYGLTPEYIKTKYESRKYEVPQFAKPNFKWLPEDEPPPRTKTETIEKIEPKKPSIVPIPDKPITPKLNLQPKPQPQTKPSSEKKVGFIKPRRQGGWSKQPFLMNIFPGLYTSKKQNGVKEANSYTFGKEPGVGRAIGKVLTGFADDKGKGYSISPSEVMKNLAMPASLLSSCAPQRSDRYVPQKNAGNPHYKGYNSKYPMRQRGRCW